MSVSQNSKMHGGNLFENKVASVAFLCVSASLFLFFCVFCRPICSSFPNPDCKTYHDKTLLISNMDPNAKFLAGRHARLLLAKAQARKPAPNYCGNAAQNKEQAQARADSSPRRDLSKKHMVGMLAHKVVQHMRDEQQQEEMPEKADSAAADAGADEPEQPPPKKHQSCCAGHGAAEEKPHESDPNSTYSRMMASMRQLGSVRCFKKITCLHASMCYFFKTCGIVFFVLQQCCQGS